MTDSTETQTATSNTPSHYAYTVRKREGDKGFWTRIWLEFPKASNRAAANTLHRLGFHWNQRRCVWQHPCGACAPFATHPQDPRNKYGSYFAADMKTA